MDSPRETRFLPILHDLESTGVFHLLQFSGRFGDFLEALSAFLGRHELLHSRIAAVDDEYTSSGIHPDAVGKIELPFTVPKSTPLCDEIPVAIELLDSMVPGVADIHTTGSIDGDSPWGPNLAGFLRQRTAGVTGFRTSSPFRDELGKHIGARIELLDAVISHIDHIHRPIRLIDGDATGKIELCHPHCRNFPMHDEFPGRIEFLNPEVRAIDDVDISSYPIGRNAPGRIELTFTVPSRTEFHDVPAELAVELLNPMIVGIDDIGIALRIARCRSDCENSNSLNRNFPTG